MKLAIERLQRVFRLPPRERVILAQAWGLFLLVDLALRILPFKRILAFCQPFPPGRRNGSTAERSPSVSRVVWLVEIAGRYAPGRAACLKKALVLSWIFRRIDVATTLQIGVSRQEGRLKAHAWVDYDGQTIFGHEESERYEPLLQA